jgi:acetylglutamate kinase
MVSPVEKAAVLVETLPFMRRFAGKTMVIKYGGNAMINDELKNSVIQDIVLLKYVGVRPVVVHGGGPEITGFLKRLGKTSEFVSGLRITDEETVSVAEMVLAGKINREIVSRLHYNGAKAVGLSGKDGGLITARKHLAKVHEAGTVREVDIGYVGDVETINTEILHTLLEGGYIPVIAPVGIGRDQMTYNINADYVAGEIAGALKAEKLMLLTDVEGIYRNYEDKTSFISTLPLAEAKRLIQDGTIGGGMIPKVETCLKALEGGAAKTHIIDGRQPHSILLEIFTSQGIGTEVVG